MKLSREKIQRMIGQREAGGGGGSSFDPSTLAGFATQSWVEQAYIAKAFWNEIFIIHKKETTTITEPGEDPVVTVHTDLDDPTVLPFAPNELPSTTVTTDEETGIEVTVATSIDSIEAKVGFWTDFYLSALGQGSGGGGGGASTLANLLDVELTLPIDNGQALVYDSQLGKWVNGAGGGGATALGNLTDVQLTTPIDDGQALVYNITLGKWVNGASTLANLTDVQLTTPLSDGQGLVYDGTLGKWVNGDGFLTQTAADLRYLKLAGGTMTNTDLVTNLNADLLDGTHKAELFSSLTTSGNDLSITIGGTTKTLAVPYATKAGQLNIARSLWGNSFDGTADITGTLTIDNSNWLRFKNQSGTARRVMSLYNDSNTDKLIIGFDTCTDRIDTFLDGQNINFRYFANGASSASLGMILNSSGNVGIGTPSPSYKLHVNGYAFATRFYLASGVYLEYDSTNSGVHLVGAGFYSDSYVTALGQGSGGGGGGGASALYECTDVRKDPNADKVADASTGKVLTYGNDGKWYAKAVTVTDISGNAGTATKLLTARSLWGNSFDGTADITGTLTIDNSNWLRFKNQSGTARRVMSLFNDSGTDKLIIGFDTCTDGIDTYLDGENVRLRYHASGDVSASLGMILNSSGNVGIGTDSPSYKLHVNGYAFATRFYLASGVYLEYDSANSGVHLVGAGFYSDSYVTALGQGSGGGGGGGALADLVDVALSNPQTGEVLMYNGTTHKWYNGTVQSGGSGTVTSITAGTGLSGGTITVSGTIAIDSTYQGYISHGETAYGWGNHANAGYLTQTTADGRYLKLSGGTMTGQIEMATGNYWYDARNYAIIRNTKSGASDESYRSVFSSNTKNGDWSMGTMGADDKLYAVYSTGSSSGYVKLTFPTTAGTLALTSDISSAVADYLPLTGGTMANTTVVTNLNADLLDGTHKANLFSSLTTSSNDISITIGGTNKTLTVPYATKAAQLNTARTLWGQSFDGSANISGDMTDVGDVTLNYNKWIKYKDSSDVARNVISFYYDSTSNNQYLFVGNGTRRAGHDSYFEGNNIHMRTNTGVSGTTAMYLKSDGCVGIGTTSPTHPLHVVGNMCVTANQNAAYIQIGLIKIIYDGTNNALKIEKSDGTAANIYATGSVVSLA